MIHPSKIVETTGKGKIFWISGVGAIEGALGSATIKHHVSPSEMCGNKKTHNASIFYIESRNVHQVESQMKGVLCAVYLKEHSSHCYRWRLCIVWKYVADQDCLQLFVSRGHTKPAPYGISGVYPDFYWGLPGKIPGSTSESHASADTKAFSEQFYPKLLECSKSHVIFLNQCQGCLPPLVAPFKVVCRTNA